MENLLIIKDLWSNLKEETRPIVLYGMGDGAEKIITICGEHGIHISGVFASTGFVRHNNFHDWTVESLEELEARLGQMVILLAFGNTKPKVLDFIDALEEKHVLYIPDLPVAGEEYFSSSYFKEHYNEFSKALSLFKDELSRKTFINLLYYKLTGERKYLVKDTVSREEMFAEIFTFGKEEVFVDAGAYRGDTIQEFLSLVGGGYSHIFALEPDGKNYRKLKENTAGLNNITIIEGAAWNKEELLYFMPKSGRSGRVEKGEPNTRGILIDNMTEGFTVSYIKYDVEGAELEALEGSKETIASYYPKLLISAYHRPEDLFKLPLWVKEHAPEYSFYLRRNPGYPAWDINLMCIKEL